MNKLSSKQQELWNRISNILWEKWDPIGVYEKDGEWDDEYDSYVPHLFKIAIEGRDYTHISTSLTAIINQSIGLNAKPGNELDVKVAKLIIEAKMELLG